jgi:large subunit ribosomal protein L22
MVLQRFHARARGRGASVEKPFAQITIVVEELREKKDAEAKAPAKGKAKSKGKAPAKKAAAKKPAAKKTAKENA